MITANTASTLTVDTTSDNLTGIPANAQVVIIPYWTPATPDRSLVRLIQPPADTCRISRRSLSCNLRVDHSRRRSARPLCSTSVVSGDN